MNFNECRSWYDGYRIGSYEIYAPRSVVSAMQNEEYDSYWNRTSTFRVVKDAVALDPNNLKSDIESMIAGGSIPLSVTKFENDPTRISGRDDILTYLCHLGYLAYDKTTMTCRIPNREVRGEWINAMEDLDGYSDALNIIRDSKSLIESTWAFDDIAVAKALDKAHSKLTSPLSYNNEQSMQSAIRLAFMYADSLYTVIPECPSSKGYADIAYISFKPNIPAMIIELKVDKSANTAINQIKEKRYFANLDKYIGNLLLVSISYDMKVKKYSCKIEKA